MDVSAEVFQAVRSRLFGIAYRMLGSVQDAEDVLQDAWLRWNGTDRDAVAEPGAYLAPVVTRLAIAEVSRARSRRETYVGPSPRRSGRRSCCGRRSTTRTSASPRCSRRRSPTRGSSPRGRGSTSTRRARPVDAAERQRLLAAFVAAAEAGDLEALEGVLAEGVVSISDGGGRVLAARKIVDGSARVARFLLGVLDKFARDVAVEPVVVNGDVAMLGRRPDGSPHALWTVETGADGILGVYIVLNPDKLSRFEGPSALS